ncbi:MAG: T9SS type A sorting domain-containing protein [Bacteroidia bacterium]
MKKLLFSMLCIMAFATMLNAKTIYVTPTGSNAAGGGLSWSDPVGLSRGASLAASGDAIYMMGGTYNFTKSAPTAGGAFGTAAGISYYGSFAGTESTPSERATSDVDGNGIIDPWEFTNQTILNFTLTNSSAGFITSNASTTATNINGFKLTGTNTASTFSTGTSAKQTLRIGKNIIFENNIISNWVVTSTLDGTNIQTPFFAIADNYTAKINNCLFENNNISYAATASLSSDSPFFPFICLTNAPATATTGNSMSNCVVRNNKVTMDWSGASSTGATNTRGLIIAIKAPLLGTTDLSSTLQNTIIHNNEVNFIPKPGVIDTCYGALVYTYNQSTAAADYIINCTIANNKTTKCGGAGLKIGMDLAAPHEKPNHTIMNNVMFNNFNNNIINNIVSNFPIPETSTTIVVNNICNGGVTNIVNVGFLQSGNLFDLSNDNANATTGANFFRPTTTIGNVADGSSEKSNWRIKADSYLKWKGKPSSASTDKAGFLYADIPSVGAYEYNSLFSALQAIKGSGTFEIYPNPAQDIIKINTSENSRISIYTITGAMMMSVNTENAGVQSINVSNLLKGNYLVTLKSNGQISHQKLIKQ